MKISLTNAGKRFNRDWIFRNIDQEFISGTAYAITGPNGSGKSTLLQVIGGAIMMSEGKAKYTIGNGQWAIDNTNAPEKEIEVDNAFQYISIAAPYLELIEEMTVVEMLEFHAQFKPFLSRITIPDIISIIGLKAASHKQIRFYSSGMKQRVKLAQAIFSDVPCVLLDEPCTNLDAVGIELYHQLIRDYGNNRLIIVSSNDPQEYSFCTEMISIMDYKTVKR
ncbi:ABC transporter ATP-binding protein [Niastella yeongjuensis]|uniref:ABC transporter ATP-binding protein n=1 Tax=Niastella yeongjuensis TaxID=354355 RepID=A0A1V9EY67_9BACT|nr:ATP-binding cassette domain-containing protein [Niastella yeongjuensis]OQP50996.1 ABC transporter ATP-binding protein [Niastella yeongjuensis]SEN07849.1 ABC-type multidrug transport system, ATPase component [Niastella yeongjuensis]